MNVILMLSLSDQLPSSVSLPLLLDPPVSGADFTLPARMEAPKLLGRPQLRGTRFEFLESHRNPAVMQMLL